MEIPASISYLEELVLRHPFGWNMTEAKDQGAFSFEQIDPFYWQQIAEANWKFAIYIGALYIVVIHVLQEWMRNRPAYSGLKGPLILWNFAIGFLSILGFWRSAPGFFEVLSRPSGFYDTICTRNGANIQTIFWLYVFTVLKYVELGDTIFILLMKKPLVFLQWYHHVVTMSVVWITAPLMEPVGRWYVLMNNGVHSIMYPYLALKSLDIKMPRMMAYVIMALEVLQMVMGLLVNSLSFYYYQTGRDCFRATRSINLFALLYSSFLLLFGKMFYDEVILKPRKLNKLAKKE